MGLEIPAIYDSFDSPGPAQHLLLIEYLCTNVKLLFLKKSYQKMFAKVLNLSKRELAFQVWKKSFTFINPAISKVNCEFMCLYSAIQEIFVGEIGNPLFHIFLFFL